MKLSDFDMKLWLSLLFLQAYIESPVAHHSSLTIEILVGGELTVRKTQEVDVSVMRSHYPELVVS